MAGQPERPDALRLVRDLLVQSAGGFLRNVVWEPSWTCRACAGIPSPGYPLCWACSSYVGHEDLTADQLGFITYGHWPHQSGQVLHGYKDPYPPAGARRVMALMLAYALNRHYPCLIRASGLVPTGWAVVPSLKHPGQDHPLAGLVRPMMRVTPEVPMLAAGHPRDPRGFTPDNFEVPQPLSGEHVLLLDDTWTTGGHIQSASAALKRAGAGRVTALVMARWLDPNWANTKEFMESRLTADFNPDICPFTGQPC